MSVATIQKRNLHKRRLARITKLVTKWRERFEIDPDVKIEIILRAAGTRFYSARLNGTKEGPLAVTFRSGKSRQAPFCIWIEPRAFTRRKISIEHIIVHEIIHVRSAWDCDRSNIRSGVRNELEIVVNYLADWAIQLEKEETPTNLGDS